MKIAIIGTRGIPNAYGGFEQFAEYLSKYLCNNGHSVTVYNSSNHPYQDTVWNGVNIVHIYDPENKIGAVGQFIYDLKCILHSRNQQFDLILQLGYTSSSIWGFLFNRKTKIFTNMDGLEWKRSKYSNPVQKFLKYAEYLGIKYSDHIIADSIGIKKYLEAKYNINTSYIPYGAEIFKTPDERVVELQNLTPFEYDLIIARLEPENNIETILNGFTKSTIKRQILVIGNQQTKFGQYLVEKFMLDGRIVFFGPIYDIDILNNLRYFSNIYFHGHSVGGTNPSLLEAMASHGLICAHNNVFNKAILEGHAFYFEECGEITKIVETIDKNDYSEFLNRNLEKISSLYSWERVNKSYEQLFESKIKIE